MIGLLRSWRLWLAVGLAAGAASVVAVGLHQARTIGEQEAELAIRQAAIEELGSQLARQHEQHQVAMAARDAALEAEKAHALAAQNRARGLSDEIRNARAADAEIDACMGVRLPDGLAERLRQ
ncbi:MULTISPECIES: hypothetical protein [unclassified Halomonas]|uniref:hypothetical protein n=1 Tax=unclassified Halomonas TaxID=2609666 RepID=UPI0028862E91|nr:MULTISPECIES: hypothetical protein [unclassified Halomonas]MDT0499697.1 hypothetical protein [Halomonas sp. PAR7]MDT0510486.1 hypothetical protein [Halomonas sp. LES1]MDT0589805.1 hypothetical protein [Halomonas sp. PAR8]